MYSTPICAVNKWLDAQGMMKSMLQDVLIEIARGIVIALFMVLGLSSPFAVPAPATPTTESVPSAVATSTLYAVTKVVDGDTIHIDINGKSEAVRLIGINTPETVDPRRPVECFGRQASNKAKELLEGKKVRIETESSQGERDKYGRLLGYVTLEDGLFFNEYMVEEGYAYEYTYHLPYKYQAQFKAAQKEAQTQGKGLWAPGVCEK